MQIEASKKERLVIIILSILYVVGFFGSIIPGYKATFLSLSPITLCLSFIAIVLCTKPPKTPTFLFLAFAGVVGFIAEFIGVNTGLLFGSYRYLTNLGVKIADVPLIISVNWAILTIGAAHYAMIISQNKRMRIALAATFMLIFDIIMEPVAIKSQFWVWEGGDIPIYNYVCWFIIGFILQFIYFSKIKDTPNKVFIALFTMMLLFFILLNLF